MWTSREAPHQRPDAQLQDSRAARGQRVRRRGAQVRAHAAADHGRGEATQFCVILLIFTTVQKYFVD